MPKLKGPENPLRWLSEVLAFGELLASIIWERLCAHRTLDVRDPRCLVCLACGALWKDGKLT